MDSFSNVHAELAYTTTLSSPLVKKIKRTSFGEQLRSRHKSAQNADIFRACYVRNVLRNSASIFIHTTQGMTFGASAVNSGQEAPAGRGRENEDDHSQADALFYESISVQEVDFFISHVWSSSRWLKWLALCYYANIKAAVTIAVVTWLVAAALLIHIKGYAAYGGQSDTLVPLLVWLPVSVFMVTFFLGHRMFPCLGRTRAWLDKLCIHQSRSDLKILGVASLPEFVANSKKLLILWSEPYFERLWCNAEVATFLATNGGDHVAFMPLWMAPWVLVTILVDVFCMWIYDHHLSILIPWTGDFIGQHFSFLGQNWVSFLTQTFGIGLSLGLSYAPAVPVIYISFTMKIQLHDKMLQQVREYNLQDAKCALESDRAFVVERVMILFTEMSHLGFNPDSPDAGPIERFNYYIHNDLADAIAAQVGNISRLPWHMCMLVFMPLNFEALANVLGCDGMPCEESWVAEGFSSQTEYIATNALMWLHGVFLIYPLTYPVMLTGLVKLKYLLEGYPVLQTCASMLTVAACYLVIVGFLMGSVCGVVSTAVISQKPGWYAGWLACLVTLLYWNCTLFGANRH